MYVRLLNLYLTQAGLVRSKPDGLSPLSDKSRVHARLYAAAHANSNNSLSREWRINMANKTKQKTPNICASTYVDI